MKKDTTCEKCVDYYGADVNSKSFVEGKCTKN